MKRLWLIPFILSAFFLFSGIDSAFCGPGDKVIDRPREVDEADTVPFDFIPLSTSEIVPGKGRFDYYLSDTITFGKLTASHGMRVEGGGLTFHERLQEVCTKNETVVADDNSEWIVEVGDYMEGALKELIPEIESAIDRRNSVRPEIDREIRDLDKPALELYLETNKKDLLQAEIDYIERMILGEEAYREQKEEVSTPAPGWNAYDSILTSDMERMVVGPDGEEITQTEAYTKLLMIYALAKGYKDNPEMQKRMITAILECKPD